MRILHLPQVNSAEQDAATGKPTCNAASYKDVPDFTSTDLPDGEKFTLGIKAI